MLGVGVATGAAPLRSASPGVTSLSAIQGSHISPRAPPTTIGASPSSPRVAVSPPRPPEAARLSYPLALARPPAGITTRAEAPPMASNLPALISIGVVLSGAALGMAIALMVSKRILRSARSVPPPPRSSFAPQDRTPSSPVVPGASRAPRRVLRQVHSLLPPLAMAMARGRRKKGHRKLATAAEADDAGV